MVDVNREILCWARNRSGLSLEEAAKKLGINDTNRLDAEARLTLIEKGDEKPSGQLLEKMAHVYRRPLLTFYLENPPEEVATGEDFRTLPGEVSRRDKALVDTVVRNLCVRQALVKATLEEEEEAIELPFIASASIDDGPERVASDIADQIAFNMEEYRNLPEESAFRYLRDLVEGAGIFVLLVDNLGNYHTMVPVDLFRGFALADKVAPFIAVNADDSRRAMAFTVIHELAHLWIGKSGIGDHRSENEVEKFCNDVAVKFLLPEGVEDLVIPAGSSLEGIFGMVRDFADARNVSIAMVAYALLKVGKITDSVFSGIYSAINSRYAARKNERREAARKKKGGPSPHWIRYHRAGKALADFTRRMLASQAITATKAGKILGVSGKNVYAVLDADKTNHRTA